MHEILAVLHKHIVDVSVPWASISGLLNQLHFVRDATC